MWLSCIFQATRVEPSFFRNLALQSPKQINPSQKLTFLGLYLVMGKLEFKEVFENHLPSFLTLTVLIPDEEKKIN